MTQAQLDAQLSLAELIEQLVAARTGGRIRDLRVDVADREIVLSGTTSTYYNKQLATHAVLDRLEGLSLSNEIEVR
jgi:hypothetical protein